MQQPTEAGASQLHTEGPYVTALWDILDAIKSKGVNDEVSAFVSL